MFNIISVLILSLLPILYPRSGGMKVCDFEDAPDKIVLLESMVKNDCILIVDEGAHAVFPELTKYIRQYHPSVRLGLYINSYSVAFKQPPDGQFIYKPSSKEIFDKVNANNYWLRYNDGTNVLGSSGTWIYDISNSKVRDICISAWSKAFTNTGSDCAMLDEHHRTIGFIKNRINIAVTDSAWNFGTNNIGRRMGIYHPIPNGNCLPLIVYQTRFMQNALGNPTKTLNDALMYCSLSGDENERFIIIQDTQKQYTAQLVILSSLVDGIYQMSDRNFIDAETPAIWKQGSFGRPIEYLNVDQDQQLIPILIFEPNNWVGREFTNATIWLNLISMECKVDWK